MTTERAARPAVTPYRGCRVSECPAWRSQSARYRAARIVPSITSRFSAFLNGSPKSTVPSPGSGVRQRRARCRRSTACGVSSNSARQAQGDKTRNGGRYDNSSDHVRGTLGRSTVSELQAGRRRIRPASTMASRPGSRARMAVC